MQHHSDDVAAAGPLDLNSSAGACQRLTSGVHIHLSTVTVLLAAVWALILHAAQSVLACINSGLSNQTATAKAHLLLLKQASPSRFYRATAAKVLAQSAAPAAPQHTPEQQQQLSSRTGPVCEGGPAVVPGTSSILRGHASTKRRQRRAVQEPTQHAQPAGLRHAEATCTLVHRHPSTAATVSGLVARIPMQLQEHRGRLTIALDLDETLLCTYRIEDCAGGGDTLQLVPANRPGTNSPSNSGGGGLSWFSSSGRTSSGGGSAGSRSSRGSSGGSSLGSYSVSTQWLGLPGELGAAARASAWMHYIPPAPSARTSSSSSSDGSMDSLPPPQQLPGPHSLAVFLRPGCREFLCQLACFAEVVLFTAALPQYGAPLAELLDPSGKVFRGRLYADACTNRAGRRGVKDLQVLGRDERRVVLVDNCLFSFLAQPRNGLPCQPYHGAPGDTQLLSVILPLLRSLSQVGDDIRPLLDNMFRVRQWLASKGYHTPEEL